MKSHLTRILFILCILSLSIPSQAKPLVAYAWGINTSGQLGNGTRLDSIYATPIGQLTDAIQVAVGTEFALALNKDGTVWAWGNNTLGQLGDGTFASHLFPTQIPNFTDVVQVSAGGSNALALKKDGTVWAWGINQNGQLGNDSDLGSNVPVQVKNLSDIVGVAMGTYHGVALKKDGTVWQWGLPFNTIYRAPIVVEGLTDVVQLSCGTTFSLALKKDGTVWGWGRNFDGQLGIGNTTQQTRLPIQAQKLVNIVQISAGTAHALAVDKDNNAWAWGKNDSGQLGDGTHTTRYIPAIVSKLSKIVQVSAGFRHSLALQKEGTVQAMGYPLGNGTWDPSSSPVPVTGLTGVSQIAAGSLFSLSLGALVTPVNKTATTALKRSFPETNPILLQSHTVLKGTKTPIVGGLIRFSIAGSVVGDVLSDTKGDAILALPPSYKPGSYTYSTEFIGNTVYGGSTGTAGLTITPFNSKVHGQVFVWGDNTFGQQGDKTQFSSPLPHQVLGIANITQVAGGMRHSLALSADGTLWSWGWNNSGQLGNGTTTDSNKPLHITSLTDLEQISAGGSHSLALKFDGTVWAWGSNVVGQLGDGTKTDRNAPNQITSLVDVFQVSAGNSHSTALDSQGAIWTWGWNFNGQLGDGTNTDRNTPAQIAGLSGMVQVSAGWMHTLALKSDGTVWAWGANAKGQLGDGTNTDRNAPVQVAGLTDIVEVEAGSEHSLALKSDGTVWAWGANFNGQLGDGTNADKNTPVQATGLSGMVQVSTGWTHSLALKSDGTVWAWGANDNGQLGDGTNTGKNTPAQALYLEGQNLLSAGGNHSLSVFVQPRKSLISLVVPKHPYAEPFTLDASLIQPKTTHALKRKPIHFFIGATAVGTALTDKMGKATLPNPKILNAGSYPLKARYNGDIFFTGSTSSVTITIFKANTKLTAKSVNLVYGEKKPISATLRRSSDKGTPEKMPIAFTLDDVSIGIAKTDTTGTATRNYKLDEAITPGKHTLKASFAGDANHNPSSVTFTLTANLAPTNLTQPSLGGKAGSTVNLTAKLKRTIGGAFLAGRVVNFFVDGTAVGTGTTGADGIATFAYTITQAKGKYKLKVTFDGDTNDLPSTYEKALLAVK